jgi:hypothetical protein
MARKKLTSLADVMWKNLARAFAADASEYPTHESRSPGKVLPCPGMSNTGAGKHVPAVRFTGNLNEV